MIFSLSGIFAACTGNLDVDPGVGRASLQKIVLPPVANIVTAPALPVSGYCPTGVTEIALMIGVTEIARLTCNGSSFSGTLDLSGEADGTVTIISTDADTGDEIVEADVLIDQTAPTGALNGGIPNYANQSNIAAFPVSGTCSEAGEAVRIEMGVVAVRVTCETNTFATTLDLTALPQGAVTLKAKILDTAGNELLLTRNVTKDTTQVSSLSLTGVPDDPSPTLALDIEVVGAEIVEYRYKLGVETSTDCSVVSGYSAAIPVATHITDDISGLADVLLRLCVLAIDVAGNQTPLNSALSAGWVKDTTIALALIGAYSPAGFHSNSNADRSVNITGVQLTDYKAVAVKDMTCTAAATDWSALPFVPVATPFTFSISGEGAYRVCAIGRNVAMFVQSAATQTSSAPLVYDVTEPTYTLTGTVTARSKVATHTVRFQANEDVAGFDASDINVSNATLGTITQVNARTYDISLTASAEGAARITIPGTGWTDLAGNATLQGAEYIEFVYDVTPPLPVISSVRGDPSMFTMFTATIDFGEDVPGVSLSSIATDRAGLANLTGGPQVYTVEVTPDSTLPLAASLSLSISAGAVQDPAGNDNLPSAVFSRNLDGSGPGVTLTSADSPAISGSLTVLVGLTKEVTDLDVSDFSVTNGIATGLNPLSTTQYELTVMPMIDGAVLVQIAAGIIHDTTGNANTVSNTLSRIYDTTPPTPTVSGPAGTHFGTSTLSVDIVFTKSVTGLVAGDLSVTNGSVQSLSGSGTTYSAVILPAAEGVVTVQVPAAVAVDHAANANAVSNTVSRTYDATLPTCSITGGPTSWIATTTASFTQTCSDDISVSDVECRLGSGAWAPCTTTMTHDLAGLVTGPHTLSLRATDIAGNFSIVQTRSFMVDLSAPPAPNVSAAGTSSASPQFTFSALDAESGVASYECSLAVGAPSYAACTSGQVFTNGNALPGVTYTFSVRAINNAGSTGSAGTVSWTNGGFAAWGACSVSCGGGTQYRTCTSPAPSSSPAGMACSGPTSQVCNVDSCGCATPWGSNVVLGGSTTAYSTATPTGACVAVSETRNCDMGGTLDGSFAYGSCNAGCALPWGGNITHGQTVTAYHGANPSGSCASEARTCNNGTLSGTYTEQSCTEGCNLPWGGALASGGSVTAYSDDAPEGLCTGVAVTRTCTAGVLSGSGAYQYGSCSNGCTRPWGGFVSHGNAITAFSSALPSGNCVSESRMCNDGTFSGTFTAQSCTPGCAAYSMTHGQSATGYAFASAASEAACGTTGTRTCTNGVASGSGGQYASCSFPSSSPGEDCGGAAPALTWYQAVGRCGDQHAYWNSGGRTQIGFDAQATTECNNEAPGWGGNWATCNNIRFCGSGTLVFDSATNSCTKN